ncbi:type II toxin-antitoxin system VapC family toxin [Comamonas badia]|uniref:type II toxin-antitoxin system VapC family toxin n=1 Tax=Comamonas badia TaxID=265291 RepID=UPI00040DF31D|nr:type II toxin-antitoxin system VapC family toxin [Comamonas badia]
MRYLLDTNICIHLIQRQPPHVLQRLAALRQGQVLMSVVTYAELCAGLEMQSRNREHDARVLALLVQRIPVLPFTATTAQAYGVLCAAVRERRRDALNRLIAAHAIEANAVLVTNNEADFRDYPGLQMENWVRDV